MLSGKQFIPIFLTQTFVVLTFTCSLKAQQVICPQSDPYACYLFDTSFKGKIQIIDRYFREVNGAALIPKYTYDTSSYYSVKKALYAEYDSAGSDLTDMFEGLHFDLTGSFKLLRAKNGKEIRIFDTVYSYNGTTYVESTVFFPGLSTFVLRQEKSGDSGCNYLIRVFNSTKKLKERYYSRSSSRNVTDDQLLVKLKKEYCGHFMILEYDSHFPNLIQSINNYGKSKGKGKFALTASNTFQYSKTGQLISSTYIRATEHSKKVITSKYFYFEN